MRYSLFLLMIQFILYHAQCLCFLYMRFIALWLLFHIRYIYLCCGAFHWYDPSLSLDRLIVPACCAMIMMMIVQKFSFSLSYMIFTFLTPAITNHHHHSLCLAESVVILALQPLSRKAQKLTKSHKNQSEVVTALGMRRPSPHSHTNCQSHFSIQFVMIIASRSRVDHLHLLFFLNKLNSLEPLSLRFVPYVFVCSRSSATRKFNLILFMYSYIVFKKNCEIIFKFVQQRQLQHTHTHNRRLCFN